MDLHEIYDKDTGQSCEIIQGISSQDYLRDLTRNIMMKTLGNLARSYVKFEFIIKEFGMKYNSRTLGNPARSYVKQ